MARKSSGAPSSGSKTDVDMQKMAVPFRNIRLMIVGLVVIVSGFVLMAGGRSADPDVFNWSMFSFARLTAAPVLIICGIVIEVVAIIRRPSSHEKEDRK